MVDIPYYYTQTLLLGDVGFQQLTYYIIMTFKLPLEISAEESAKILAQLNSLKSTEELESRIHKRTKRMTFKHGDAKRIFQIKLKSGEFKDLEQIWAVRRIGIEKFCLIVRTFDE